MTCKKLKESDFLPGGIFQDLVLPRELPTPKEILKYVYEKDFCNLDKLVHLNLLKKAWELKGVFLFNCKCQTHGHLLTQTECQEQKDFCQKLDTSDFKENGVFHNLELTPNLPLDPIILKHIWGKLSYFDSIPEGKCFKSDEYQLQILKACFEFKYKDVFPFICTCKKHLIIN